MFHLINIVDVARDARSEANLKRLELRDAASATLLKRHVDGATIISPAMQEVIKEEKNQGFKKQIITIRIEITEEIPLVVFHMDTIHQPFNWLKPYRN
jgi:hypothetical protein